MSSLKENISNRCRVFCLPVSKNLKIKVHKTIILPVVLYRCETWSFTDWGFLRTECWGRYLGLKGRKTDRGENCTMMNFITCILHRILLRWLNQGWGGLDMWHAWGKGDVFKGFWLGGPKGRDHWEDLGVDGRITLRWTLERYGSMGRTGFGWLSIGSRGGVP
jgi:hypothetical protein